MAAPLRFFAFTLLLKDDFKDGLLEPHLGVNRCSFRNVAALSEDLRK